jgi:hypothetical protein
MGGRKAAFQSASRGSVPLVWAPRGDATDSPSTQSVVAMSSELDLHPPFGMCGMQIAAHIDQAPACSGRREPIEEVA